ncbi:MAG: cell division protein FtsQ/DivIB [Proteobacteria bacterium]|nr:cell division protein FtsQ/DivIB [Pseudomonadota bacterium]
MRALMQPFRQANGKAGPTRRRAVRGRTQRWSPWRRKAVLLLIPVMMAAWGFGAWELKQSGIVASAMSTASAKLAVWGDRQMVRAGLTVRHVFVTGRGETSKPQVLGAMGVRNGQSILSFNPVEARRKLLQLGWIETARVERRLPDTIVVHLSERKALALWQHKGRHVLIDRGGKPITRYNLARFAHLPVVVGQDAPAAAAALIDMLAQKPALFARVQAAVRIGSRRWDVRLKNGINVHLPETQAADAWGRLAELVAEHRIFERDVAAIDLRLPDRLVLRLTPEAAAKKNKNGKET